MATPSIASTSKMTVGGTKVDNFRAGLGVFLWLGTEHFKTLGRKREPAASERSVTGTSSLVRHASRVTALTVHPHGHTLVICNITVAVVWQQ